MSTGEKGTFVKDTCVMSLPEKICEEDDRPTIHNAFKKGSIIETKIWSNTNSVDNHANWVNKLRLNEYPRNKQNPRNVAHADTATGKAMMIVHRFHDGLCTLPVELHSFAVIAACDSCAPRVIFKRQESIFEA